MAKHKKSVVLYCDLIHTIEKMDNKTAGQFFKHYLRYINDLNPITDNLVVDLTFESVKQNLKRDLNKWENEKVKKSDSGSLGNLKRWHPDIYNKIMSKKITLKEGLANSQSIAKHRSAINAIAKDRVATNAIANVANVAVNVNDNVNVIEKDINMSSDKKPTTDILDFNKLLNFINQSQKRTGKSKFTVITPATKNKFKARLKEGYTKENIQNAIINASKDKYHLENNFKYLKPDYFSRAGTLDLHGFKTTSKKNNISREEFTKNPYNL